MTSVTISTAAPAPVRRGGIVAYPYREGEQIGPWTVGEEASTPSGTYGRRCSCACGTRRVLSFARLADLRRLIGQGATIVGCRACADRAKRVPARWVRSDVTATRAVAQITTERRISGAAQNLRDLEERSPLDAHAVRADLERMHRELIAIGRVKQAAILHAVMRLAEYAREGGR